MMEKRVTLPMPCDSIVSISASISSHARSAQLPMGEYELFADRKGRTGQCHRRFARLRSQLPIARRA